MRLMVTMCKYISVLYVDINKFAIVVVHNGPLKKKKKKNQCQLQVPEARLKSYGERSFGFSAPTEWNKLPINVRSALTLASFKVKLKTHLYKICFK